MADLPSGGLDSAMTHSGLIRTDRWDRAIAAGEVIGTCAACGGFLIPDDFGWADESPIMWFTASCLDCKHEVAAPNGHVRKRRERGRSGW